MRFSLPDIVAALTIPGMAALGGAAVVYSEYDDAPGGVLFGLLLILGAVALSLWNSQRNA